MNLLIENVSATAMPVDSPLESSVKNSSRLEFVPIVIFTKFAKKPPQTRLPPSWR
jgi:hypothetical protein